ncbi:hypothetical protein [Maribacter dokdonensis]|uniref:hypothetical protein n=1 Tax=Maribacter dokdonensis TaxID=320912 RepID=UPI001B3202F1|nr:hypothetical protein [Maribacter dokdonensis]
MVRKVTALLSFHFKIPFPEQLPDDEFWDKWEQLQWALFFESKRQAAKEGETVGI